MKKFRLFALVATLFVALGAMAELPSVKLKDINGNNVDPSTLSNDGKPFIIDFFATWCKPCNRELDAINEVYADWQEETGVKVICVSINEAQDTNKVKPLVDSKGWEFETVLLDPNSDLLHSLGGQMIPYVVICDGNGNIVDTRNGYIEGSESHLIEKVRELVNSK